jgi:hypothetical protein
VTAALTQEIAGTQKRITDLTTQAGQPFDYGQRLAFLVRRQQEMADALDLTKDAAPSRLDANSSSRTPDEDTATEPW